MPDEPDTTPRQRFTWDLRRVREARDVTVAEIHEATRISESQIESFEAGALYDQPAMNPVYLRAFVRAYAEVVGLPPDAAVQHLEAALDGSYEHQLATEHLDVPPSVIEDPPPGLSPPGFSEEEASEVEVPREIDVEPDDSKPDQQESSDGTEPSDAPPGPEDEGPLTGGTEEDALGESASPGEDQASRPSWLEEDPGREEDREDLEELLVDPSLQGDTLSTREPSTPGGPPFAGRSVRRSGSARSERSWGVWAARYRELLLTGLSILVLLGVLGVLGISYFGGSASSSESEARSPGSSPTSDPADSSASSNLRSPANLTLGDTLHVTVLATSRVQRMQVRQDEDLRRPYWIEEGKATVFPFTRRIMLENQLDEARLFLEQYPYPTSRTDSLGRVVIDRQTVEAFADTLRGSPATLSVEPDTVAIRTPSSEDVNK